VTSAHVAEAIACGPDLERHRQGIRAYADAGFDELYVQQVGPDQQAFFDAYRDHVLPGLSLPT
jgi:hypothetical protein